MVKRSSSARQGNVARKAPDGLDKVLFVRANQELLDKLESLRQRRNAQHRGITLSKADVARALLWDGIEREEKED